MTYPAVELPSSSSKTPPCLRFRCWIVAVVLPCHAMSLLHVLQLTHFFCLLSVKCSHTLDDLGRTDFSAFAMYLSSTSTRFFFLLLRPVYEAPNSASISARERPCVFTPLRAQLNFFFFFIIKRLRVARHNESIMKFVANTFSNRFLSI